MLRFSPPNGMGESGRKQFHSNVKRNTHTARWRWSGLRRTAKAIIYISSNPSYSRLWYACQRAHTHTNGIPESWACASASLCMCERAFTMCTAIGSMALIHINIITMICERILTLKSIKNYHARNCGHWRWETKPS